MSFPTSLYYRNLWKWNWFGKARCATLSRIKSEFQNFHVVNQNLREFTSFNIPRNNYARWTGFEKEQTILNFNTFWDLYILLKVNSSHRGSTRKMNCKCLGYENEENKIIITYHNKFTLPECWISKNKRLIWHIKELW